MDVNELKGIEYQPNRYHKILQTTKGKGIGLTRDGSLYKLGFCDGGRPIQEFNRSFMTPVQAYKYAESVIKKLDEEGRGKKVKKEGKVEKQSVKTKAASKRKSFVPSD